MEIHLQAAGLEPNLTYTAAKTLYTRRPKPGTTRLWTIQPPDVWEALREQKTLLVNPSHPNFAGSENLKAAYDWLREQMAERIPGYAGNYPWWAYEHFLDLRFYRWHIGEAGERLVRLELAVPTEQVLLSAYGSWHCVLSRGYLPEAVEWKDYEQEWNAWEAAAEQAGVQVRRQNPLVEPWETQLRKSWERIFNVDALRPTETIQANFERLRLSDVVKVTEFTSLNT